MPLAMKAYYCAGMASHTYYVCGETLNITVAGVLRHLVDMYKLGLVIRFHGSLVDVCFSPLRWKGVTLPIQKLCGGDWDRTLCFTVYDWNR